MSWTCFECHVQAQAGCENYLANRAVARDADLSGRRREAREIRLLAAAMLIGTADYHLAMKQVDERVDGPWAGQVVWAQEPGVSVGECEECARIKPCVNV
jgi:hypothetical protein